MGELRTISTKKSKVREEQLRQERAARERRRRLIQEKKRREKKIRKIAVGTTIVCLGLIGILLMVSMMTGKDETADNKTEVNGQIIVEEPVEVSFDPSSYSFTLDMYKYENSLEVLEKLEQLKSSQDGISEVIDFMLENEKAYPENLIKLVIKSPEAIEFALEYPFKRGQNNDTTVDLTQDYIKGEIPLLLQWDTRWGYVSYGDDIIALDGCGPTCLSMVAIGLTGNVKWTPVRVARISEQNDYYVSGQGTAWTLMSEGCNIMGLQSEVIGLSETEMVSELEAGHPIIASMGPGDFTEAGHFIVIVDYEDGMFYVNDPNSRRNSAVGWTFDNIKDQIKNMWSYSYVR